MRTARHESGATAANHVLRGIVAAVCMSPVGCSYIESIMEREGQPDDRTVVSEREGVVSVSRRDLPRYVCATDFLLVCDNAGGSTYSCHCDLR